MIELRANRKSAFRTMVLMGALGAIGVLTARPAEAHFVLQSPTNWATTNTQTGMPQKTAPCGTLTESGATLVDGGASAASGVVNPLTANADGTTTVSITIDEVVHHAGWYRVSLVKGASSTQTVATLPNPPTPATSCAATIESSLTGSVVADGKLMHTAAFTAAQTFTVTLPAGVTCTHAQPCTLQVVEVMNDGAHFPPGCFYHHCADIAIAPFGGDAGSTTGGGGDGGSGSSGSTIDSGAVDLPDATASGSSGAIGSSGSSATAGSSGSGGVATTGMSSSGTTNPTRGASGAGGVASATGSGGSSLQGGSAPSSGGGCLISARGGTPAATGLLSLFALAAVRRRRRGSTL